MEYRATLQTKVIRTEHKILLSRNGKASALKKALANIPDNAELIDEDEIQGSSILIFVDEKEDN